jgi:hypothetical protein
MTLSDAVANVNQALLVWSGIKVGNWKLRREKKDPDTKAEQNAIIHIKHTLKELEAFGLFL